MEFPYEIWDTIVSYLPIGQAKRLYAVNRTLFNIAMDLRYQEARLWTGTPKARVRKDLRVFRYPHLSSRPKTLHIDLTSIAKSLSPLDREGPSWGQTIFNIVARGEYDQPNSAPEIFAVALDALPRLTAVTKLSIVHDYTGGWRDDPLIRQIITNVWKNLGDRLQLLQVKVAVENLQLILPTSLRLPYLDTLAINAEGYCRGAAKAAETIVCTMIQSHSPSLRDVSFTTKNTAIDLEQIFRSLECLPRLQAIHLSLPFGPFFPHPFPAYDMLYSCRDRLEVLSLEFSTNMDEVAPSLFCEDWCYVDLPHVKDLRVNPPVFGQEFIEYIHRFSLSLISLSIASNLMLRYPAVKQLSSIFRDFLSLRNLSIRIRCFCPDILALLARMPHLQTLNLRYSYISPTVEGDLLEDPELSRLFYSAMQKHTSILREWELVSFNHAPFWARRASSAEIEKALTDHLPNVKWFCGLERSAYLNRARKPTPASFLSDATTMLSKMVPAGRSVIRNLTSTD